MKQARKKPLHSSKRPKTFSGCQTCRNRHLKCGEERPACTRCTKAKIKCLGYPGYRAEVIWTPVRGLVDGDKTRPEQSSSDTSDKVSADTIDDNEIARSTRTFTPTHNESFNQQENHSDPHRWRIEDLTQFEEGGIHSELPDEIRRTSTLTPSPFDNRLSSRTLPVAPGTHLDSLPNLKLQLQLMDHWTTMLSDALMPTPGSYNPNKDIFVPIALEGASSSITETSGAVTLFYLIFAASAFHLSANCADTSKALELMTVALSHHSRGITHLQQNLARDDRDQQEAILSCLLLCITYEPVTVETSFWRTHLSGVSSWLRKKDIKSLCQTESSAMLYQTLAGTAIFLRSQLTFDEVGLDENFPFDIQIFLNEPYYLLDVFGLPKPTLRDISNTISLVTKLRHHSCSETPECDSSSCSLYSEDQLDRIELQLYLSIPKEFEGTVLNCKKNITYHYTRIFYYASLIYFKRILRSDSLTSVQPLVEQSFHHIEALEGCTTRAFSPLVWPIAISFLEMEKIEYQQRALIWLDFITKRSQLSIWPKLKAMLHAFWSERDMTAKNAHDLKWDVYLNDLETPDIMLV